MTVPVLAVPTVNKYHVEQRDYPADDEVDILFILKQIVLHIFKHHSKI